MTFTLHSITNLKLNTDWNYTALVNPDASFFQLTYSLADGSELPRDPINFSALFAVATTINGKIHLFDIERVYGKREADIIHKPIPRQVSPFWFLAFKNRFIPRSRQPWRITVRVFEPSEIPAEVLFFTFSF